MIRTNWIFLISLMLLFLFAANASAESLQGQFRQKVEQLQKRPADTALREEIIKLALKMKPEPAVSEEAERRMARGIAAFQGAKSVADYQLAASEFEQATNAAPWYGDAYYNLGLAQDKAGNFSGALQSLKFAALASPGNREIKNLLYQVEYRRDQAKAKAEAAKNIARALEPLRGNWNILKCSVDRNTETGCTSDEMSGVNWQRLYDWNIGAIKIYQFKFNSDNTVEIEIPFAGIYGWAKKIVGTPNGRGDTPYTGIDWVCHYESDTRTNRALAAATSLGPIIFTCDRPEDGGSYSQRYHYREFRPPK